MKVLITGSRGYIGSTLAKTLVEYGILPIGIDRELRPKGSAIYGLFYEKNFEDEEVAQLVVDLKIDTICHLAADASVPDSVKDPGKYYQNNVAATIQFLNNLIRKGWRGKFIFSSSAAVYPDTGTMSKETDVPLPCNPYGMTKLVNEQTLRDYFGAFDISVMCFRYFNVAGGWDDVGDHLNAEHVIQRMCYSAANQTPFVMFNDQASTPDGTCVRDYLHVRDVCEAHVHAISYLKKHPGYYIYNLGTSRGTSIKQLVSSFITSTGENLFFEKGPGRIGDPDYLVADGHLFVSDTGYTYKHSELNNIISSAWKYYSNKKKEYGYGV